ncbi:MAG: NFYB/HAP3 family transcription factor subunit [Nanoarchaeota archaeon]|nr:NFYB/HAP3 family transcription factor subunit [Nanoarchaeota archaeon]
MKSKKQIKEIIVKAYSKKIGRDALERLDNLNEEFIKEQLERASRKADISGRKIIKKEDFD